MSHFSYKCVSAHSDSWITPCRPLGLEGDRDTRSAESQNHNANPRWDRKSNMDKERERERAAAAYRENINIPLFVRTVLYCSGRLQRDVGCYLCEGWKVLRE